MVTNFMIDDKNPEVGISTPWGDFMSPSACQCCFWEVSLPIILPNASYLLPGGLEEVLQRSF